MVTTGRAPALTVADGADFVFGDLNGNVSRAQKVILFPAIRAILRHMIGRDDITVLDTVFLAHRDQLERQPVQLGVFVVELLANLLLVGAQLRLEAQQRLHHLREVRAAPAALRLQLGGQPLDLRREERHHVVALALVHVHACVTGARAQTNLRRRQRWGRRRQRTRRLRTR